MSKSRPINKNDIQYLFLSLQRVLVNCINILPKINNLLHCYNKCKIKEHMLLYVLKLSLTGNIYISNWNTFIYYYWITLRKNRWLYYMDIIKTFPLPEENLIFPHHFSDSSYSVIENSSLHIECFIFKELSPRAPK